MGLTRAKWLPVTSLNWNETRAIVKSRAYSDANQNEADQGGGWIGRESGELCGGIELIIFHAAKIR